MGSARAVLVAERFNIISQLGQRGGCRSPGQSGTHYYDVVLSLVSRVYQLDIELMLGPFFGQGAFGYFRIQCHDNDYLLRYNTIGIMANRPGTMIAYA